MIPSLIEYENIGPTVMSSTYVFNDDEDSSHIRLRQCDHHALSLILPVNTAKEMDIRVQSKSQQHHSFSSNSLRKKFVCTETMREKLDTKSENDYDAKPSLVRKSLDLETYRKVESRQQAFECLRRLDNLYDMHNNDVNDISTNATPHSSRAKSSKNTDGGNNDNNNISGNGKTGMKVSKELQKMKLIRKRSSEIRRDLFAGNRESSVTNVRLDYSSLVASEVIQ